MLREATRVAHYDFLFLVDVAPMHANTAVFPQTPTRRREPVALSTCSSTHDNVEFETGAGAHASLRPERDLLGGRGWRYETKASTESARQIMSQCSVPRICSSRGEVMSFSREFESPLAGNIKKRHLSNLALDFVYFLSGQRFLSGKHVFQVQEGAQRG